MDVTFRGFKGKKTLKSSTDWVNSDKDLFILSQKGKFTEDHVGCGGLRYNILKLRLICLVIINWSWYDEKISWMLIDFFWKGILLIWDEDTF